jgi:type IV pilus assembly protein PilW
MDFWVGHKAEKGFSLVELLVAMVLSGLVISAIYTVFTAQRETYYTQEQVAEMQQNVRSAIDIISREVRMAGYDPSSDATCAVIETATTGRLKFYLDLNGDGDCIDSFEEVEFGFSSANDADLDGVANAGAADLGRELGGAGGFQDLAENIHAIGFAYAVDADDDGDVDDDGAGNIIWGMSSGGNWWSLDANGDGLINASDVGASGNIDGVDTGFAVNLDDIRAVKIWILARSAAEDPDFENNATYVVGRNIITVNDGYRRRLLTYNVSCRNMGL